MRAASNLLFRQGGKPAFDLVEPRCRGRREVNMESGMANKPVPDCRRLMGTVVVHHEVDVQVSWNGRFNSAQELRKFTAAMTAMQFSDELSSSDIKRSEQRRYRTCYGNN